MPLQCPTCSKVNPSSATYCYYDGRALGHSGQAAVVGTMPFVTPFSFSDGQSCANFNQLALACDRHWTEARDFLVQGIWHTFFSRMGRHDLASAAAQAAKESDIDVGLSYLLERLPTDALRPPTLGLVSEVEDLGSLEPGKDQKFEIVISNQGMLILCGKVVTDCDWLYFGERQGTTSRKLFQTRDTFTLVVRVMGNKLRAGPKPFEAQVVIDTNGGTRTVLVRAQVPIIPFPKGKNANDVLAGARSPRELAVKAKAHPNEASALFEQGAVKAWYTRNGWTYPIQGTQGRGKAAVQQYFEALGLTKPPQLEISTERIVCRGEPGKRVTKMVTISTKESKFVNAEAHSNQDWVEVQPAEAQGNHVTIPVVIEIPRGRGPASRSRPTSRSWATASSSSSCRSR